MSEEMDLFTDRAKKPPGVVDIYVPLLNEGTDVLRPTKGISMGRRQFKILATDNYDLKDEEWEFPPNSIVECCLEKKNDRDILVARKRIP